MKCVLCIKVSSLQSVLVREVPLCSTVLHGKYVYSTLALEREREIVKEETALRKRIKNKNCCLHVIDYIIVIHNGQCYMHLVCAFKHTFT